jgi:hypothetical protein
MCFEEFLEPLSNSVIILKQSFVTYGSKKTAQTASFGDSVSDLLLQ